MTLKILLYCVIVMIFCVVNIEDVLIFFFCCVLFLFRFFSGLFLLFFLVLETNFFFLGGEFDLLILLLLLGVFFLYYCLIKFAVVYLWFLLTVDFMNRCKCAVYLFRRCFLVIVKDM